MDDLTYTVMQKGTILYFIGEFEPKNEDPHSYAHYKALFYNGDGLIHNSWIPEHSIYQLRRVFKDLNISNFIINPSLDFKLQGKKIVELYNSIIDKSKETITTKSDLFFSGMPVTVIPKGTKLQLIGNKFHYNNFVLDYKRGQEFPELPNSILVRNENEWKMVKKVLSTLLYSHDEIIPFPVSIKIDLQSKNSTVNQPNPMDINGSEFWKNIAPIIWR